MGVRKSVFSAARKKRAINKNYQIKLSPTKHAKVVKEMDIRRKKTISLLDSPQRAANLQNNRERVSSWRKICGRRCETFKNLSLRSVKVLLKKLSADDIIRIRKSFSPREHDSRKFAKHNFGKRDITSTFPSRFRLGAMDQECPFCGSMSFLHETKFSCCRGGKVSLNPLSPYPAALESLLTEDSDDAKNFRKHIRKYNNLFAFASTRMRQSSDLPANRFGSGVIRISGHVYHKTGQLYPGSGKEPFYNHFYIYDGEEALNHRSASLLYDVNLSNTVTRIIQAVIDNNNSFARSYRRLHEVEQEERAKALSEGRAPIEYYMTFVDRRPGSRTTNKPVTQEVAAVFSSADGAPPKREFVVRGQDNKFYFLDDTDSRVDPLCYPLLFPSGDLGYTINIPHVGENVSSVRNRVTLREFYNYRLCVRNGQFNPLFFARMLFQQYLVDAYVKIEADRLFYLKRNQSRLRVDNYKGLLNYLENRDNVVANSVPAGTPVILPSTYEGSPRAQQMRYQDAMAVVGKYGKPDLFVTVTCNPRWPEIVENLNHGQKAEDAPHLTARVFQLYKEQILKEIWSDGVLGKCATNVSVIEFQKRGLPHCHILLHLKADDKLLAPCDIDKLICAEIPDERFQPLLYETVKNCMMHGPCGEVRPNCPCMRDDGDGLKCSKKFPKDFNAVTKIIGKSAYPEYRRRDMPDRRVKKTGSFGTVHLDNRWVVPYNPYLTQKFNCHINVESCHNVNAVKYIYKYIYKGHDEGSLRFQQGTHDYNEIESFVEGRYVSAPEAAWRIFSFPMHDNSHVVARLPCHLHDGQRVFFREGEEQNAADAVKDSELVAWFKYNTVNPTIKLFYTDMVQDHVFVNNTWRRRKRKAKKPVIGRMYNVSPRDVESFHLRLLLLHIPGAKSYEELRTVDGTVYNTYKEACAAHGLIADNSEYIKTMRDVVHYAKPAQCRRVFGYLLLFCDVADVFDLWDRFKAELCEDFVRKGYSPSVAESMALRGINALLVRNGSSLVDHGLPDVDMDGEGDDDHVVPDAEAVERHYECLNVDQKSAADQICEHMRNFVEGRPNVFSIDGPAGTGKTYLYNYLLQYAALHNIKAMPSAWVGIAATLLRNGRTCHATFKLPVPCIDGSKCNVSPACEYAEQLRSTTLFIIDEISSVSSFALDAIDLMMRDVCSNDFPFGGKVFVLGGDFRQTLTVVKNSSVADLLSASVISSRLWSLCKRFSLTVNMRTRKDQKEFAKFLLHLGCDRLPKRSSQPFFDCVEVPHACVTTSDICKAIFPDNLPVEEYASRVILTPTNKVSLDVNEKILDRVLPGSCRVMYSADSVLSDDSSDCDMYPVDFLNSLTPTGMPQHSLKLKVGAIVMLLRNFDLKVGLTNGTRLKVLSIHRRLLKVQILCGFNRGTIHHLPKIVFQPSDSGLPFILKRRQFPVRVAYCMTINKSQGQTFDKVGIYLEKPCFAHGQLYVAFSRAQAAQDVKVFVKSFGSTQGVVGTSYFTTNVVLHSVLQAAGVSYPSDSSPVNISVVSTHFSPRTPARFTPPRESDFDFVRNIPPLSSTLKQSLMNDVPATSFISPIRKGSPLSKNVTPISVVTAMLSPMSIRDEVDFVIGSSVRRRGLVNFGNTCYANSILQLLFNVSTTLENAMYLGDCAFTSTSDHTFLDMSHIAVSSSAFRPVSFIADLTRIMPEGFDANQQQDVPEVLQPVLSRLIDSGYYSPNDFVIHCRVVLECNVCLATSSNRETYNVLPVQVRPSVQACIDHFLLPEQLDEERGWQCSRCNLRQESLKTQVFEQLPSFLFVQMKRFEFDPTTLSYVKCEDPVSLSPSISISSVDDITNLRRDHSYVLNSLIHHQGNFQAGHYTASVLQNESWLHCNDSVVTDTVFEQLNNETAYVLLYRKV